MSKTAQIKKEKLGQATFRFSPVSFRALLHKGYAEYLTLDMGILVHAKQIHSWQKQPNLKKKSWAEQLIGSLLLAFVFWWTKGMQSF